MLNFATAVKTWPAWSPCDHWAMGSLMVASKTCSVRCPIPRCYYSSAFLEEVDIIQPVCVRTYPNWLTIPGNLLPLQFMEASSVWEACLQSFDHKDWFFRDTILADPVIFPKLYYCSAGPFDGSCSFGFAVTSFLKWQWPLPIVYFKFFHFSVNFHCRSTFDGQLPALKAKSEYSSRLF